MNKYKKSFFIVVITVAMLLILGNWATSAQATSSEIIDVTPIPTIVPTETPSGEIPSAEEVEELKAIVQSYIEVRYRALSISDAEDFTQNGFGGLASDIQEAGIFLREEKAKLAVQIKHAELDHLRYVNYKVFLNFRNITIDSVTQTATISVIEGNEVVYEISEELNPENPVVSHSGGIKHTIILRKKQDMWRIISDTYYDDLWKMLRQMGSSTDEILRFTDELLHTMKATPRSTRGTNKIEISPAYSAVLDDPSSHTYDRAGAVEYALKYWGDTYGEENNADASGYNPNYPILLLENDCQNFVSQVIYEGGNASMYIPSELISFPPRDASK